MLLLVKLMFTDDALDTPHFILQQKRHYFAAHFQFNRF